jgi:uncharacterized protein YkwD
MANGHRAGISLIVALAAIATLLPTAGTHADPLALINALRVDGGCRAPAAAAPVRRNPTLDAAAEQLSRGDGLKDALGRVGYPAASSTSLHVGGSREDDAIRQVLASRFCSSINDPQYDEVGVYQNGTQTWIVLALSQLAKPALEPAAVANRVLELVNAARAQMRICGRDRYAATQPLRLSALLNDAALGQAHDMAARGSLGHEGSDGSTSGDRITRAGYRWRAAGENIAAGQRDAEAVVAAWLESPGHCANLMSPQFTEMGLAFALAQGKDPAIYWAQVFAAP